MDGSGYGRAFESALWAMLLLGFLFGSCTCAVGYEAHKHLTVKVEAK